MREFGFEGDAAIPLETSRRPLDVSIVLPVFNEEESLEKVCRQVEDVLDSAGLEFEILVVEDGSTDGTWGVLKRISEADDRVRALKHRRNFGKASALANGFAYARGTVVVACDGDLQYDPNDILRVIEKVYEGFDVVCARKVVRRDPLTKRIPSRFFNFFVRNATGVPLHDINTGLKAFSLDAARNLVGYGYGELHRFFAVIASRKGYRVTEIPVESLPRTNGKSKYGVERYVRGALDFLTVFFLSGYLERPLHLLGGLGLVVMALGGSLLGYLTLIGLITGRSVGDRPLLLVSVLFIIAGLQLLVTGLIAEMINNLQRGSERADKIAQVLRVERRNGGVKPSTLLVERRHRGRGREPDGDRRLREVA